MGSGLGWGWNKIDHELIIVEGGSLVIHGNAGSYSVYFYIYLKFSIIKSESKTDQNKTKLQNHVCIELKSYFIVVSTHRSQICLLGPYRPPLFPLPCAGL